MQLHLNQYFLQTKTIRLNDQLIRFFSAIILRRLKYFLKTNRNNWEILLKVKPTSMPITVTKIHERINYTLRIFLHFPKPRVHQNLSISNLVSIPELFLFSDSDLIHNGQLYFFYQQSLQNSESDQWTINFHFLSPRLFTTTVRHRVRKWTKNLRRSQK